MATPSEETKKSASKMTLGGVGKSLLGGAKKAGGVIKKLFSKKPTSELIDKTNQTPVEVLGEIYKMMKIMDEDKKLNHEMANSHLESEELKKEERNKEIIKALTGRKGKKPKIKPLRDEKGRFRKAEDTPAPKTGQPTTQTPTQPSTPPPKTGGQPAAPAPKTGGQPAAPAPKTGGQPAAPAPKTGGQPATQPAAPAPKTGGQPAAPAPKTGGQPTVNQPATNVPAKPPAQPAAQPAVKPPPVKTTPATTVKPPPAKTTPTAPPVKTPPVVSTSPIIPGVSAAAAASMSLEVGATTKEEALKSVGKIVPNDPEPGVFSYGLFGINSGRKKTKEGKIIPSSIDSFVKDNPQFNLPDPGNTEKFQSAWKKLARENPESMYQAQLKWYKERVENPTIATLSEYVPEEIFKNKSVIMYMADRANQYGPLANWTNAVKYAKGSKDYKEFLRKVSEYDKAHIDQNFQTYLSNNPKNRPGLENRIEKRLASALNLKLESVSNNNVGEKINENSVQNKNGKEQLSAQDQKVLDNNTTIVNQQQNTTPSNIVRDDDRPEWYKKLFTPRLKD